MSAYAPLPILLHTFYVYINSHTHTHTHTHTHAWGTHQEGGFSDLSSTEGKSTAYI